MPDYYHTPALVLTALLLPTFGYLYLRFRDARTLLWLLGFVFATGHTLLFYMGDVFPVSWALVPWERAAGQACSTVSSVMFLGSLSPRSFRVGRLRVLYAVAYCVPFLVFSLVFTGWLHGAAPRGAFYLLAPALGVAAFAIAFVWIYTEKALPRWGGFPLCALLGGLSLWLCFHVDLVDFDWPMTMVESCNHLLFALLIVCIYRRFSSGVFLSALGFSAWSLTMLEILPAMSRNEPLQLGLIRIVVLSKVVAAVGMILLVLEYELAVNEAAEHRERRARLELEAYAKLLLTRRRLEDFDNQGAEICATVVEHSRFSQAALLLADSSGRYRLSGADGIDPAVVSALAALAPRIPLEGFLAAGSAPEAVAHCQTLRLDLTPWLAPGDDLERLRFTSVFAVPLSGRSSTEGAILLAAMRSYQSHSAFRRDAPLSADDLLPIEILATRLQSVRSQTILLEKLIDSEKFAGLGQLASNVTQQLNNPLTVIMGYASLLESAPGLKSNDRKGVEAILAESRRMKATLESLSRVSWSRADQLAAVSVAELLADLEELHRGDFLHRSIRFSTHIAPELPRALCHAHQIRQAVLHCLHFAAEAVEKQAVASPGRTIRLEASAEGGRVQIMVAHSGAAFPDPERAFDSFVPQQAMGESATLGLSLCSTILRDNDGHASAINLSPSGAAIVLELQSA